ncbi:2-keto-myo-inositol dehydratase [Singulisphaera sp. GP187]|uniref:myo-inosose-2 dehydratase n=1 Tax=Singulisphaera sp. GP187 TaxID=1882752 RepID=UPI00092B5F7C|nr:myo-inosose-2 dehydratase [Singulisphaera sp. GP187]SIO57748.1 2-keto-myo-inositol dehydratase [Singulisphaera sp. GP187]
MNTGSKTLDPKKVPFGITPTLWWNDDFPSIDIGVTFGECVSEMALAGFVGCSVGHKYPTDPKVLKPALELRGLRVSEPWVSTYFTIKEMKQRTLHTFHQQMKFLKEMGATDMVVAEFGQAVNPLPAVSIFANRPIFTDHQWSELLNGLEELGRLSNDNGLRLCYHPHMGTGVMIEEDVDRLMENTNPDLVHLLLDTGHLAFAGADPLRVTRKYGRRIKHIHLKDVRADVVTRVHKEHLSFYDAIEAGVFTVPGDGAIDFVPIFAALAEADFEGWLVIEAEQDPAKANPLKYAKMARSYLHETLGW